MKTTTLLAGMLVTLALYGCGGGVDGTGGEGGTTTTDTGGGGTDTGTATGGTDTGTATGGTASSGGTNTGGASTGGTSTGGADVQCTANPPVFPTFDKHCLTTQDCLLVFHQINCCGTRVAIGI